jgi:hypothetical protein
MTEKIIIADVKEELELRFMPTRLMMDKLSILQGIVTLTKPQDTVFTDEQKWMSIWNDDEMLAIKEKMLILIRDL